MTTGDDLPRDDWLREALRQAPDAEAAPPAALRAAILREATARAAPRPVPPWRRAWRALGQPRWAAAFASLMAMVVAGVLWWDRPLDETLPRRESAWPNAAVPPSASGMADLLSRRLRDPAAPGASAPAGPPRALAKARPAAPRPSAPRAAARPTAPVETPAPPAPSPPAAPEAALERRQRADTPASAADVPSLALGVGPLARSADTFRRSSSASGLSDTGLQLLRLRSEMMRTPGWSWQRDEGDIQPADTALDGWLARLTLALLDAGPDTPPADATPAIRLHLLRDGRVLHTFGIDATGVSWLRQDRAAPALRHLPLSRAECEALTDALKRLAP